jgi:hypothetical protein
MPELRKGIFLKGGQHPGRGVSLAGIYTGITILKIPVLLLIDKFASKGVCAFPSKERKVKNTTITRLKVVLAKLRLSVAQAMSIPDGMHNFFMMRKFKGE